MGETSTPFGCFFFLHLHPSFLAWVFLCFFMYYGFEGISGIIPALEVTNLGMQSHFNSVARGVLDTRDLVYFMSVTLFFLVLTFLKLKKS